MLSENGPDVDVLPFTDEFDTVLNAVWFVGVCAHTPYQSVNVFFIMIGARHHANEIISVVLGLEAMSIVDYTSSIKLHHTCTGSKYNYFVVNLATRVAVCPCGDELAVDGRRTPQTSTSSPRPAPAPNPGAGERGCPCHHRDP